MYFKYYLKKLLGYSLRLILACYLLLALWDNHNEVLNFIIRAFTIKDSGSLLSISLAVIALIYTIKTYQQKWGFELAGNYCVSSSVWSREKYVSNVILENRKDKSLIIYGLYLRLGNNCYLHLEGDENDPIVIKPFEVKTFRYSCVDYYPVRNGITVDLTKALDGKNNLYVKTSSGRHKVKKLNHNWSPETGFFTNIGTVQILPYRFYYKNKPVEISLDYIISVTYENGTVEDINVSWDGSWRLNKKLPPYFTKTKDHLHLYVRKISKELRIKCFEITDLKSQRWNWSKRNDVAFSEINLSWFEYNVIYKAYTIMGNLKSDIRRLKDIRKNK